jgi:hypothetical protein
MKPTSSSPVPVTRDGPRGTGNSLDAVAVMGWSGVEWES